MNEALKFALNQLQFHLENELKTDNVLLIFDNQQVKDEYIKLCKKKNYCLIDIIPITLEELEHFNKLVGTKFKKYHFVTDIELYNLKEKLESKDER